MLITKIASVGIMLSSAFLTSSNAIPGKLEYNYDPFKNRTTITVVGDQLNPNAIMYLWNGFDGHRPNSYDSVELGFLAQQGCPHPNFIADGKRVVPDPSGETQPGIDISPTQVNTNTGVTNYIFVFNFYDLAQVKQIATAKSVKYKVCDDVYSLSAGDQAELRQFLNHFKR